MVPIIVAWTVLYIRTCRVEVNQGEMAVGVRYGMAVDFGQGDGLNDGESLRGAFPQVAIRILPIEPMEKLPGGIAEPEKWLSLLGHEESSILAHLESG